MTGFSLAPAQNICDRDIIAERWRQLRKWGHERKNDAEWQSDLLDAVEFSGSPALSAAKRRAALVDVAATAVAAIEDLDNRAGDRAAVPHPFDQLEPVAA